MAKRILTMQTGLKVTVEAKSFRPAAAPDLELLAHRVIIGIVGDVAGFGTGWVVSEPKTSGLVIARPMTTRTGAMQAAEERLALPGVVDHIRHKIGLTSY